MVLANGQIRNVARVPYKTAMRPIASGCHATNLPWASGNHNGSSLKKMKIGKGGAQQVQLVFPMFHINQTTTAETLNGTNVLFRAAISVDGSDWVDFPALAGGLDINGLATDPYIKSGILTLPSRIAEGTMISVKTYFQWANGLGASFNALSVGRGEWVTNDSIDYVTSRTAPASPQAGAGFAPILLGDTQYAGWVIIGDSRMEGQNASQFGDPFGDRSFGERWVSQNLGMGYVNMGLNGDSAVDFTGNSTYRLGLTEFCNCSHALVALGVNDLLSISGTIDTFTRDRLALIARSLKRRGIRRVYMNKPAGRTTRINSGGEWVPENQAPYNVNFGPEPSKWSSLNALIGQMTNFEDSVDVVVDTELTYCNVSETDTRFLADRVNDGVHEMENVHSEIAALMPSTILY